MNMDVELDGIFRSNDTFDYSDYEYKEDFESSGSKAVWLPVVYSLVLVVGLLGNLALLALLAQKRRSWSISDTFILHLGVADILLLLTLPFGAAQAAQHCGRCFGILCKICGAVLHINFYCGMFLLLCITLDHYLSMVHAIWMFSHKQPRLVHICCLSIWLVSLLLSIPDWIFLTAKTDSAQGKTMCVHNYSRSGTDWELFSRLLHLIVGFALPAAALITCCTFILLQFGSKGLKKPRAIMIVLPLVVVFLVCWLPYNITLSVDTFRHTLKKPHDVLPATPEGSLHTALTATSALACVHACLRPLLYLGLCVNFRTRLLAMLRCGTVESQSSLWELGLGEETPPVQNHEPEELKQMTSVEQVQSTQC